MSYLLLLTNCTIRLLLLHIFNNDSVATAHYSHDLFLTYNLVHPQDEREDRELRKVEMQTQKAENMIEHEAEIYARPPRTWFQTGVSPRPSHSHCYCHMLWLAIKRLSLF